MSVLRPPLSATSIPEAFQSFARRVNLVVAIDHSGRAGNGFFQAIFDQHPEILTCPWMHYVYSYIETEFGDLPILDSARASAFLTTRAYFRYVYLDVDDRRSKEITKFGGDPAAPIDREVIRRVFQEVVASSATISRRDAVVAMYFAFAIGCGRATEAIKYILVTDAISLRTEHASSAFSGNVIDRIMYDFPDARLVQLVRDPRASFASTNHQYVNSAGNMYGLHWGNYWSSVKLLLEGRFDWERVFVFGFLLLYFRQAFLAVERKASQYHLHFRRLRNEDLNLDFITTMRALCDWLGVAALSAWSSATYVPTMLGRQWKGTGAYNSTYQTNTFGPLSNDPDKIALQVTGPNEYVTRRWRKRLAPNEIYLIEWVLHEEIRRYGYDYMELRSDNADDLTRRLSAPMRGELPTLRWILSGRHLGWRELADRVFFTVSFIPFYIGVRIQLMRLISRSGVFSGP